MVRKILGLFFISGIFFFYALAPFSTADITWYDLKEAQQLAKINNKKVLVYAEASWCGYCKKMEKEVFPNQAVQDSLKKFYYPVRIDIESEEELVFNGKKMTENKFAIQYGVTGTPTTFFIDKKGKILGAQPGFIPPRVFKNLLSFVGSGAFGKISFEEYVKKHTKK